MREIRLYGSEGGGVEPIGPSYPYPGILRICSECYFQGEEGGAHRALGARRRSSW